MLKREKEDGLSHQIICVVVMGQPSDFQSSCFWNRSAVQMRYECITGRYKIAISR